jgi:hypothetical protein
MQAQPACSCSAARWQWQGLAWCCILCSYLAREASAPTRRAVPCRPTCCRRRTGATASGRRAPCSCSAWPPPTVWRGACSSGCVCAACALMPAWRIVTFGCPHASLDATLACCGCAGTVTPCQLRAALGLHRRQTRWHWSGWSSRRGPSRGNRWAGSQSPLRMQLAAPALLGDQWRR